MNVHMPPMGRQSGGGGGSSGPLFPPITLQSGPPKPPQPPGPLRGTLVSQRGGGPPALGRGPQPSALGHRLQPPMLGPGGWWWWRCGAPSTDAGTGAWWFCPPLAAAVHQPTPSRRRRQGAPLTAGAPLSADWRIRAACRGLLPCLVLPRPWRTGHHSRRGAVRQLPGAGRVPRRRPGDRGPRHDGDLRHPWRSHTQSAAGDPAPPPRPSHQAPPGVSECRGGLGRPPPLKLAHGQVLGQATRVPGDHDPEDQLPAHCTDT